MEIKDRIEEFMAYKRLNPNSFEKELGLSKGLWRKSASVSEEVLLKLIKHYPDINSDWLLKGKGEMFGGIGEEILPPESASNSELIQLCKLLVSNYKQRDEVMNKLVSMVDNTKS